MDEKTVVENAPKTPLPRKILILAGATAGLILAGGFAFAKFGVDEDESVSEDTPTE